MSRLLVDNSSPFCARAINFNATKKAYKTSAAAKLCKLIQLFSELWPRKTRLRYSFARFEGMSVGRTCLSRAPAPSASEISQTCKKVNFTLLHQHCSLYRIKNGVGQLGFLQEDDCGSGIDRISICGGLKKRFSEQDNCSTHLLKQLAIKALFSRSEFHV